MTRSVSAPRSTAGLVTALSSGVVGVAGSYALVGASRSFVAVPVHSLVVDLMPAPVLTFSILVLGELGELVGFALALALTCLVLAGVTLAALWLGRRFGAAAAVGGTYGGGWAVAALLTNAPWTSLATAVPMAAVVGVDAWRATSVPGRVDGDRRSLVRLVGALGFASLAALVGSREPVGTPPRLSTIPPAEQARIDRRLSAARERDLGLRGSTGLVSSVTEFYEVDIDSVDPNPEPADWSLSVTGAVDDRLVVGYDDLTSMDPVHEFVTLRCVGEPLNGHLMDNALWTGVPASRLLDKAGVQSDATHVVLHAVDGYDEEFPLDALRDGLLAYGMNGRLLPRAHGAPVRALVPGHWGEVNVKWLTEVELIAGERTGYWEERGWHGTGPVTTVAKLHAVNHLPDGRVRVGGHAYAGTRGVQAVQVSVDGGASWSEARLSAPLPDADVWRQWAYAYRPPTEPHEVVVRAVDGTGTVQPQRRTAAFPSGATGWVSERVQP